MIITHTISASGYCPDCGIQMRARTLQVEDVEMISCASISEAERLQIQVEQAEDRLRHLQRQLARMERSKTADEG